jgi:superfamily II DNA/RNA helicase
VISYEVPLHVNSLVHRCGRTARAGKSGDAYVLMEDHQVLGVTALPLISKRRNSLIL